MSEDNITLYDLLNLSIGTPQQGAVNFSALHPLLHAVLKHLGIREMRIRWSDSTPGDAHTDALMGVTGPGEDRHTEEEQLQLEGDMKHDVQPSIELLQQQITSSAADESKLRSRIQTCEDGVSKAMRLIHELHNQKDNLKDEIKELRHQQKAVGAEAETITAVETCCHRLDALEEAVGSLMDTYQKYPDPEELSRCVTWDVMQSALLNEGENHKDSVRTAAPGSPATSGEILTLQGDLGTQPATETSLVLSGPPQQTHPKTGRVAAGLSLSLSASNSEHYSETVEALRNIGRLRENFNKLEARVAVLEKGKVDQTQLDQLREIISEHGSQDVTNNLMDQVNEQRALIDGLMSDREKSVQLVNDVQKVILQLQAECEKLHETTRCLHEDNTQKQNHIEELYKTTEELEEKKADKQMVESEIKADKSALDSKVSRLQFDSATEQLNTMFHELQNKVTDQEQDWHKVIDKLSTEMECKLVRIELDSVKKQLEDCRKNIHEKLQSQGAAENDDAAGIRKQLVDRFHCLSCDRPVVKQTPGPHLMTLPSTPGFPSNKSIRPFTVYALEQFRQHYRSLKPGTNCYNFEVAKSGRRRERLQRSHDVMCRQIESAQRRLKHCDRAGSQDTMSNNLNQKQLGVQHHTVTSASQRRTGLQYMKHHNQPEGDGVIQSEEVDIIGLDGHIYRGRLNPPAIRTTETKLPTISTKDVTAGLCKIKDKAKCSPSYKPTTSPEVGHNAPVHHPHSPKTAQCSRSASSSSGRDWPVSALGCTSQSSITQASAAADSNTEPQDNQQADL
ncbi:glutamine-rich protein 2-like [Seriola lalandi dorsalis]|uniref:glutamine-rich protein 2-like n=1 Tax=Seriola lalandi dorsalis TaxID=1841481 RepID=UPI000C6F8A1A|nr:glutamine-rich protein 2-like [Seriola lalandi dorsalis]